MTTVFFTSDLHIGHEHVSKLRGFETIDEHDDWLQTRWREFVKPHDLVWILGDVMLRDADRALDIVAGLPGRKHLILGNHDDPFPSHREYWRHQTKWMHKAFESVSPFAKKKYGKKEFYLSHFPFGQYGDGPERPGSSRYMEFRLPQLPGMKLVHGHVHSKDTIWGHDNELFHVGVDAWDGEPVPLEVIHDWLDKY